ncbi:MAG: endonuclease III [Phycisphaerae bacterium]|nr:endonuclease III [Phycisphaerae bacterium]
MTSTRAARVSHRGTVPRGTAAQKRRAQRILAALQERYPEAHCELRWSKPHELLIATILSAQCTDVAVNKATPALFAHFPGPADYVASTPAEIEPFIRSLGFFRQKAKSIHAAMSTVVANFGGDVPRTMDELLTLRGVARKTANVVLGNAFGIDEGVVVDTHVMRLARRFGLTKHTDPTKIELDLMARFPQASWTELSHLLIFHGRRACKARGNRCADDSICQQFCSEASS